MIARSPLSMRVAALALTTAVACTADAPPQDRPPKDAPAAGPATSPSAGPGTSPSAAPRLHWFLPDGLRADPEVFDIYRWAEEGDLPNLAALMKRGVYGWSIPAFPSHTPANYATLLTGARPDVHGVADGPMHVEGRPLALPSLGGFSSAARKVPAAWSLFEAAKARVFLLSVPGSTPPELGPGGVTVRGRWGGWGADVPSVVFERASPERQRAMAKSARLFLVGEELTRFVAPTPDPAGGATIDLPVAGVPLRGHLPDSGGSVTFTLGDTPLATLSPGEWSPWAPVTLTWKGQSVASTIRVGVIRADADGFFRVRVLVDGLNRLVVEPPEVADSLRAAAGPMVDFPDSFPAQLVYFPEDKATFLAEARESLAWHARAVDAAYQGSHPDVMIHSLYTPNQLLTSRWWMGAVDPASRRYASVDEASRAALWGEVREVYRGIDAILGRAVADAGPDALIAFGSDHGAIPLDRSVRLNNLFAERGWLTTTPDPVTGAPTIDWAASKVVFLNMHNVYVSPDGLGGDWTRASGPAYEHLRDEVRAAIAGLSDGPDAPLADVVPWERAASLHLPGDRVGDLVIAARPGFGWSEELTADGDVFATPLVAGYKQAVAPDTTPGLWTPFVLAGPGVAAGRRLSAPIHHEDQLPTLLTVLGLPVPAWVTGKVVTEVLP